MASEIFRASEAGFNTVVIEAFSRGFSRFPSHICAASGLPRQHPKYPKTDCVAEACAAARRTGTAVYASISCLNAGPRRQSPASPFLRRRSDLLLRGLPRRWLGSRPWTPRDYQPSSNDVWLCPSSAAARRLLAGLATELSASYPVDGILLEGLAYPPTTLGDDFCGCDTCEKHLAAELGIDLRAGWPEPGTEAHGRWCRWRADQLTQLVERIKARARKGRRSVRIAGLIGRPEPVAETDPTRMATHDWLREGLLDVFCDCESHGAASEPALSPGAGAAPAGEPLADLRWQEFTVQTGAPEWQWPSGRPATAGGVLISWSGTPSERDWQQVRSALPPRVPPLESRPLENARLFLSRAAELGAVGCAEAAEMAASIAERDRPTEPVGARLDRLLALSEVLQRMRSSSCLPEPAAADEGLKITVRAHITTAAGLTRLAILTV